MKLINNGMLYTVDDDDNDDDCDDIEHAQMRTMINVVNLTAVNLCAAVEYLYITTYESRF